MGGVGCVIREGHEAGVVHVACMSGEDEVMVPVIGIAGIMSLEGMRRASMGVVAAVGAVRWEGCS